MKRIRTYSFILIILCVISFLTSCSSPNPYPINKSEINSIDTGILLVSVKNDCKLIGAIRSTKYFIKSKDGKINFKAVVDTSTSKEFVFSCALVDFFNLPAGEYEIYSWQSWKNTGFEMWREKSGIDFSIPFKVEPGNITYLGQILLDSNYGIYFGNMKERDLNTLIEKYPLLNKFDVVEPMTYNYKQLTTDQIQIFDKSRHIYLPIPVVK